MYSAVSSTFVEPARGWFVGHDARQYAGAVEGVLYGHARERGGVCRDLDGRRAGVGVGHLIIRAAKLTQAELLRRLELQRQRGDLAEQKALEIEKRRLADLGRPDLAARVERISPHDVSAGYDIRSFEKNETPRLVEVKSSVGSQITFEWSVGERATATKHGDAYFIYFVPFSFTLPDLTSPVVLLKNPIELIHSGRLLETPSSFHVKFAGELTPASRRAQLKQSCRGSLSAAQGQNHDFLEL